MPIPRIRKIVPNEMPIAPPIASAEKKLELSAAASMPDTRHTVATAISPAAATVFRRSSLRSISRRAVRLASSRIASRSAASSGGMTSRGLTKGLDVGGVTRAGLDSACFTGQSSGAADEMGTSRTGSCNGSTCFAAGSAVCAADSTAGADSGRGVCAQTAPPPRRGWGCFDRPGRARPVVANVPCTAGSRARRLPVPGRGRPPAGVDGRLFGERWVGCHARRQLLGQRLHGRDNRSRQVVRTQGQCGYVRFDGRKFGSWRRRRFQFIERHLRRHQHRRTRRTVAVVEDSRRESSAARPGDCEAPPE